MNRRIPTAALATHAEGLHDLVNRVAELVAKGTEWTAADSALLDLQGSAEDLRAKLREDAILANREG